MWRAEIQSDAWRCHLTREVSGSWAQVKLTLAWVEATSSNTLDKPVRIHYLPLYASRTLALTVIYRYTRHAP